MSRHSRVGPAAVLFCLPVVTFSITSPNASAADAQLPEVEVTATQMPRPGSAEAGYYTDSVALGMLGNVTLQEAPYSINTVSADLIRNIQAINTSEAVKYIPTVYVNTGASQVTPYFTLRGFSASPWTYNMAVDGMRSFEIYQPMEDKERIEVMGGATGFLNGVTSPAGTFNYVTKRPTHDNFTQVTLGTYDEQGYVQVDTGGPVSENLAYRFNLGYGSTGDAGLTNQSQERYTISGAIDFKPVKDTTISIDALMAKRDLKYAQAQFMPNLITYIPKAPDASSNWGAPYDITRDGTSRITLGVESRLNEIFNLRAKYRYTDITREYAFNRMQWTNSSLAYKWRVDSQDEFDTTVNQIAAFLDAKFNTGPLKHLVTLGATQDDYDKGYDGYRSQTFATVYTNSLYGTPVYPAWVLPAKGTSTAQRTTYSTVLLSDRIQISDSWSLMAGATQAMIDDTSNSRTAAGVVTTTTYDSSKLTPAFSLSYKPIQSLNTYVSYIESLQQGGTVTAPAPNAGTVLAPYVGKQAEVGAKASFGGMNLALAYFRIEQANQYTNPTTLVVSQDGREVHKGWEFSATGKLTDRLTVTGGLTSIDASITKATTNVGKTPYGVPEFMARLYAEYSIPGVPGLIVDGGASYTGKVPVDSANRYYIPSVTVYDAGLRYANKIADKDVIWRLGVSNLTDKNYWTTRNNYLYLGAGRIVTLSATVGF
jgi:iron complex outermembrane recepter protein